MAGLKTVSKTIFALCLFLSCIFVTVFSNTAYGKDTKGVCESPQIELTRYLWEEGNWKYVHENEAKTFTIDNITFEIFLDSEGVTVKADGKEVAYSDYREYYAYLKNKSKGHDKGKPLKVHGKKVMVRFLNIAPDLPADGGVRWCVLQLYVESSKADCEASGGKIKKGFPAPPADEGKRLRPSR
jgi:hypothetical protein